MSQPPTPAARRPRIWPALAIAIPQWTLRFGLPAIAPDAEPFGMPTAVLGLLASVAGAVGIFIWWLFFSRYSWTERIVGLVTTTVLMVALFQVVHPSIAGAGMGFMLYLLAVPMLSLGLVVWALLSARVPSLRQPVALAGCLALVATPFALIRTAGVMGATSEFHWRWTPTPEQLLLAQAEPALPPATLSPTPTPTIAQPTTVPATSKDATAAPAVPTPEPAPAPRAEWPGFRGPNRDGVVRGSRINTDWNATPPVEMWRKPIGPGWSSFAVSGDLIYTQEQRGDDEQVSCYRLSSGEPVWRHRDPARFWESNAGAGPRATPTIHAGRVYAFGATGILNALDAATGRRIWSRNVASDTGRRIPDWGFASSPLVVDDVVIVAAAGTLAGYGVSDGAPRWKGPSYGGSYSSPHAVTLDGVPQVVLLGGPGAISVAPDTGAVLWEYAWEPGPIVQPAVTANGDLLVNTIVSTGGLGIKRLAVSQSGGRWLTTERWASIGLKPYFNDFVVHREHAYGFDGHILSSIDLTDGQRKWKGGRYGNGQLVLLADQDLLLVITEEGELVLVNATPNGFSEIARHPALDGKTWNHPVVVGDVLLVRNDQEMAAFRLSAAASGDRPVR